MAKNSYSNALIIIAQEWELFHTPDGIPCAVIENDKIKSTVMVESEEFKSLLRYEYLNRKGKSTTQKYVNERPNATDY